MRRIISSPKAPTAIGPYSQAVLVSDILYISGQIPTDSKTGIIIGIEAETHQVMKSLRPVLQKAELNFSHMVKTSIFLKDMANFPITNKIYASYLHPEKFPARETHSGKQICLKTSI